MHLTRAFLYSLDLTHSDAVFSLIEVSFPTRAFEEHSSSRPRACRKLCNNKRAMQMIKGKVTRRKGNRNEYDRVPIGWDESSGSPRLITSHVQRGRTYLVSLCDSVEWVRKLSYYHSITPAFNSDSITMRRCRVVLLTSDLSNLFFSLLHSVTSMTGNVCFESKPMNFITVLIVTDT
jgi:hypothetical protein